MSKGKKAADSSLAADSSPAVDPSPAEGSGLPSPSSRAVPMLDGALLEDLPEEHRQRVLAVLRPFSKQAREMSGRERLDTLLTVPHPERFIPALPKEELFFFLQDIGLDDCTELVRYASDEQLTGFVDLGCWTKDRFSFEYFQRWFSVAEHNGREHLARLLHAMDQELLVLLLVRSAKVWDTREAPEDLPDNRLLMPSPDGTFQLEMDADDDRFPFLRNLLMAIYAHDVDEGRKLLQACRWELPSPLEESGLRWRTARLEDMGFVSFDEAIEFEAGLDLATLEALLADPAAGQDAAGQDAGTTERVEEERSPETAAVSPFTGWFLAKADDAPFLSAVFADMPAGPERDAVLSGFVFALNRRLSLRGLETAEWGTVEAEAANVFRTVSLGLEWAQRKTGRTPERLLQSQSLLVWYRAGRSLLTRVSRAAADVVRRAGRALGHSPFDSPTDDVLDGLRSDPPLRYVPQPEAGNAGERRDMFEPFRSLAEIDEAEAAVHAADAVLAFFELHYDWSPERLREPTEASDLASISDEQRVGLRFSTLLLTGIANRILDRSRDLSPLGADDLRDLIDIAFVERDGVRQLDPRLRREAQAQLVSLSGRLDDERRSALGAFVDGCLSRLEDELRGLASDERPDPRFLGELVLMKG